MGLFLSMLGLPGVSRDKTMGAVESYVSWRKGELVPEQRSAQQEDTLLVAEDEGSTALCLPHGLFLDRELIARVWSKMLAAPVFAIHIHDEDLWMFDLCLEGEKVSGFNPLPNYWGDVSDQELTYYASDADLIASHVRGLAADSIKKYFVRWNAGHRHQKAYPADKYFYWDCMQLRDFMGKIGLPYPIGHANTTTYLMKVTPSRSINPGKPVLR